MTPMVRPVMRVYTAQGYMVRWRRGDRVAYVFADRDAGDGDHVVGVPGNDHVARL